MDLQWQRGMLTAAVDCAHMQTCGSLHSCGEAEAEARLPEGAKLFSACGDSCTSESRSAKSKA